MTGHPYGPSFWWTYVANTALMVAVSLLFRYADFITFLGGSEQQLGFITGLGMIGAISARCFQGVAIDRYGPGRIWFLSLALLATCLLAHLLIRSLQFPTIHLLRIVYTVSLAGAFGSSITFVSLQAPTNRLGEMIGMLGSSGFVGMGIGPVLGDWLMSGMETPWSVVMKSGGTVLTMFVWSAVAAGVSMLCCFMATRHDGLRDSNLASFGPLLDRELTDGVPASPVVGSSGVGHTFVSMWQLIRTYHPGWTLLVGVAMGIGLGMPGTFVRAFAAEKGIAGVRYFFLTYAATAFIVRIFTRRLADRWGTRPTILLGLACVTLSMLAYLSVTIEASLAFPAILVGCGHAFLFPATVSEASQAFPQAHRGLATTLILMMFDIGMLVGQPAIGYCVEATRRWGGDGYTTVFCGLATFLASVAVLYFVYKPLPVAAPLGKAAPASAPYLATKSDL